MGLNGLGRAGAEGGVGLGDKWGCAPRGDGGMGRTGRGEQLSYLSSCSTCRRLQADQVRSPGAGAASWEAITWPLGPQPLPGAPSCSTPKLCAEATPEGPLAYPPAPPTPAVRAWRTLQPRGFRPQRPPDPAAREPCLSFPAKRAPNISQSLLPLSANKRQKALKMARKATRWG